MLISPLLLLPAPGAQWAAVVAWCTDAWRLARQRRLARLTTQSLAQLDKRTLHDIGLDRSDIGAYGAELHGLSPRTFVRTALMTHGS